jgi:hypothetical protein
MGRIAPNPLTDHLVRRYTLAVGTRHNLGCVVPTAVDEAVNVLEKTDGAIALLAFRDRAGKRSHDLTIRWSARLSSRDRRLPSLREWQNDEWPGTIH